MSTDVFNRGQLDRLESQIDLSPGQLADIRFTDVEASSLFKMSHPIEVAVCGFDMQPESMLIRPLPHWDDWSSESEGVHNISQRMLELEGVDATLVAHRVNVLLKGKYVFSDNPGFDGNWYMRLFADVDLKPAFGIQEYDALILPCTKIAAKTMGPARIERLTRKAELVYVHTHRAADDALRMAAVLRLLVDPEWADWLEKADYEAVTRSLGREPVSGRRK